jgi:hypothetical protein
MKGISYTIIALIAIIFVPIVLLTSLIVISTTQTDIPAGVEAALEDFSVVYTDGNKVYVRNDGSETLGDLTFSLDGETVIASPALECLGGIKPNKICEYIVNTEDAGELTVSGKGKAVKTLLSIDYIITPTTTTTTIKKIGGHSGDSGDLPSGGGSSPMTTTTTSKVLITKELSLRTNLNYITIPVKLPAGTTASDIADDIALQGGKVTSILGWNGASQTFNSWSPFAPQSNNFIIEAGVGYIIRIDTIPSGGTWFVTGEEYTSVVPINFVNGINLVGFPFFEGTYTASTLAEEIGNAGGEVASIHNFNADTQTFDAWTFTSSSINDFNIDNTHAYQIKLLKPPDSTFILGEVPTTTTTTIPSISTDITIDVPMAVQFNYVGIPVKLPSGTTASDVAALINSQGGEVISIQSMVPGTGSFVSWAAAAPLANNFEIENEKGYVIRITQVPTNGVWRITGKEYTESLALNVKTQWNLVNIPYTSQPYTVSSLSQAINDAGGQVISITSWNIGSQSSSVWAPVVPASNNFVIEPGIGYTIRVSQDTTSPVLP